VKGPTFRCNGSRSGISRKAPCAPRLSRLTLEPRPEMPRAELGHDAHELHRVGRGVGLGARVRVDPQGPFPRHTSGMSSGPA
jgi:hypothetical protein